MMISLLILPGILTIASLMSQALFMKHMQLKTLVMLMGAHHMEMVLIGKRTLTIEMGGEGGKRRSVAQEHSCLPQSVSRYL